MLGAPIENLTLDSTRTSASSRTEFTFRSPVSGLEATFSDGRDTITFLDAITGSTIQTDATPSGRIGGDDRLVASAGLFDSTVRTGAGRDTLLFSKEVFDSTIDTGSGNDQITLTSGSIVSNTSFSLGAGNDTLTVQGGVLGNDGNSLISLGRGADTLMARPGSSVTGTTIDLGGADGAIDQVQFLGELDPSDAIRITGASLGDLLVIGAGAFTGTYSYDGSFFANGSETLTWLT